MKVLVTGSSGVVGRALCDALLAAGCEPVGFDKAEGQDVLDPLALGRAASRCAAIVHLAAVDEAPEASGDDAFDTTTRPPSLGSAEAVVATTVVGTANALAAAEAAGHERFVFLSSAEALGVFLGARAPDYLPLDDAHPCYPASPYALAKRSAERLCQAFTVRTGVATLCLRAPGIWSEEIFAFIRRRWREDPANDRRPFWEYGAFLALEDAAAALVCALRCRVEGHHTAMLCADDAALARQTSREAAASIHPDVPWRGGAPFERDPYRTLVDNEPAKRLLGWQPRVSFRPR